MGSGITSPLRTRNSGPQTAALPAGPDQAAHRPGGSAQSTRNRPRDILRWSPLAVAAPPPRAGPGTPGTPWNTPGTLPRLGLFRAVAARETWRNRRGIAFYVWWRSPPPSLPTHLPCAWRHPRYWNTWNTPGTPLAPRVFQRRPHPDWPETSFAQVFSANGGGRLDWNTWNTIFLLL